MYSGEAEEGGGPMSSDIQDEIRERAKIITDPAGREAEILEDRTAREIAWQSGAALHEIYREALKIGVYPYRYIRNRDILSAAEQLRLAEARVAVVGAGGLGGQVVLLLARLGVGTIVVVDCDLFDETNLNRQALCVEETLGEPKTRAAVEAVAAINPGVRVIPHQVRLTADVIDGILAGSDVVVDGLDNVPDRLLLQEAAGRLGIPMVHGALAGFEGRIMTVLPGDAGVKQLYGEPASGADPDRPEAVLGVPAVTAALIGTFQAMEVLKILLRRGSLFRNTMAYVDLEQGRLEPFRFGQAPEKT
jgi:molybdopterin/thiamine biosynthesis adenylyltransferase